MWAIHISGEFFFHIYQSIKSDLAESHRVNLMMWLTIKDYHRRGLSYWFHIICNSFYLPSRPFSSSRCFVSLCPFLIIVTDRRSAENEGESPDFVLPYLCACVCVCLNARRWVGADICPIGRDLCPQRPFLVLFKARHVLLLQKFSQHQLGRYEILKALKLLEIKPWKRFFSGCQWS